MNERFLTQARCCRFGLSNERLPPLCGLLQGVEQPRRRHDLPSQQAHYATRFLLYIVRLNLRLDVSDVMTIGMTVVGMGFTTPVATPMVSHALHLDFKQFGRSSKVLQIPNLYEKDQRDYDGLGCSTTKCSD